MPSACVAGRFVAYTHDYVDLQSQTSKAILPDTSSHA